MKCAKCEGEMEEGFIADHAQSVTYPPFWYSGVFTGGTMGDVDMAKRKAFYVESWRCTACGLLEAYARIKPAD